MFDHCKSHNLDFLGNYLKMFDLKLKKMLTLGNMTLQYKRFWTGSKHYLYFIWPFYFLCTFWYTILLFYNETVIKCLFYLNVLVTFIFHVSPSARVGPLTRAQSLKPEETIHLSNNTMTTFIPPHHQDTTNMSELL